MKTPKIKFVYDRQHRSAKNVPGTVELRVSFNYKQKYMSTGISIYPRQWDEKTQRVIGSGIHQFPPQL